MSTVGTQGVRRGLCEGSLSRSLQGPVRGQWGPSVLEGTDPLKDGLFLGSGPLFPWKTADSGQSRL